ncbi:DUF7281 domain-containing protein [Candidatus Sulfurimonas baltica]|uniref:DUF7281 domain-containing protein n=1 Tax=Candidatus Sulfurimonas baltica TaxID=2740404 RepID=A0A7S7RN66_9BACT|nr:hypothetical protein [Candidatus Sulfurimonas baltica]QOY52196.1 hypothetical protein HUE88_00410 [Candidatus Sulfurimonas baltica]
MRHLSTLLKLKNEKVLNYSQLPKRLLKELLDDGLIEVKTVSANKKKVIAKDEFFTTYYNIEEIQNADTRAKLIHAHTDSKHKSLPPQDGLYINGNCSIEEVKLPLFSQSAIFLKELPNIDKSTLIIGVENFENLIYFEKQCNYFRNDNILFIFRNKKMLELFEKIENEIIYFGDFDLAGIHIYLNEIFPKNEKIKFFIPENIEQLLEKFGSRKLYASHLSRYTNMSSDNEQISELISLMHKHQKSLEQEYFLL